MRAFRTMVKTELKISLRSMDMMIFGLLMPIVVVIILGFIYGSEPASPGASYSFLAQSFGAVASIGICATGAMALPLEVSDYRNKKILKRFKVTPISPAMILFVRVIINAIIAIFSLLLVCLVSAVFFGFRMDGSWLTFLGAYFLVMLSIYSIGMMIAAIAPNIKTANLLICVFYFPMLIFSGATLPYEVMPAALQKAADVMPLTQGIKLLKAAALGLPANSVLLPIIVMIVLAVVCIAVSIRFFRWE